MSYRSIVLFTFVFVASPLASSQGLTACNGGTAGGFACNEVDLYARLSNSDQGSNYANDIWGWTDPDSGREFALVGHNDATSFVEITNPDSPVYLGKLPTATSSSTWRDIKTYSHYAFVVSEASGHGIQVFDLTKLLDVQNPPETFSSDARFTGFGGAHNIGIDPESGFAFGVGANQCSGGLYIVDVRDPLNPTQAGCFSSDGYTHDVQCVTYHGPDTDYQGSEICVASNEDSITLVDVTNKSNPTLIAKGLYPNPGYTHQGWFTEDQRFFIVNDELDHSASPTTRTIIFDVADLDNPEFDFFYFGPLDTRDHNLYVRGDYAFLSNYAGGLRVLDLTEIENGVLTEVASFDTFSGNNEYNFEGQWSNYPFFESGTIIANDQSNGLFILKTTFPLPTDAAPPAETPGESGYALSAAYPNPFADATQLQLSVARAQQVTAEVLDITGRSVARVFDDTVSPGSAFTLTVDASDLPAGLYLLRVSGEDFSTTRRISLVR